MMRPGYLINCYTKTLREDDVLYRAIRAVWSHSKSLYRRRTEQEGLEAEDDAISYVMWELSSSSDFLASLTMMMREGGGSVSDMELKGRVGSQFCELELTE